MTMEKSSKLAEWIAKLNMESLPEEVLIFSCDSQKQDIKSGFGIMQQAVLSSVKQVGYRVIQKAILLTFLMAKNSQNILEVS